MEVGSDEERNGEISKIRRKTCTQVININV